MTMRIVWVRSAVEALKKIPWTDAARVDEAVQQLARTGSGPVRRLPGDDPVTLRLSVPPYHVRLIFDPAGRVLTVIAVYRRD